jgi:hypothetical protein
MMGAVVALLAIIALLLFFILLALIAPREIRKGRAMMSAIGTDEKISTILSELLSYPCDPDTENVRVAIDGILKLIEEDRRSRPHLFVGRFDRDCELCGNPDRDAIHFVKREWMENAIKQEREACARIADHAEHPEYGMIAKEIRARSNVT